MKALPRGGKIHGETVCCAGVTAELEWRRQYPIRFRYLADSTFKRWQWIEYDYRIPSDDDRPESRRVQEDSIVLGKVLTSSSQKVNFLNSLILPSVETAMKRGQTLCLIRPRGSHFKWREKTSEQLDVERRDYALAAKQQSLFESDKEPLDPCPYEFSFSYESEDGKKHLGVCHDWETSAMYWQRSKEVGREGALKWMSEIFNSRYPAKGMVFAMGTHSRWPEQWLLNGVIRLDEVDQLPLI